VSAKDRINRALERATGYKLVEASKLDKLTARAKQKPPKPKPVAKPKPKPKDDLPGDYDAESKEIIRSVREYTMTGNAKLFALIQAVRYVVRHDIPGDFVECGVWRGGSTQAAARTLIASGDTGRDLYLFDTFEGMPPPSDVDVRHDGRSAEELMAAAESPEKSMVWAMASLEDVRDGMAKVPYPADKVHFIEGKVEDTIPAGAPERISILRLDTDWYESTRHELEHLYSRLSPGGVLILDDYGYWEGARRAVDEFLDETGERLLLTRMASGRIAVKPWA
jgi:O-methyltransferase